MIVFGFIGSSLYSDIVLCEVGKTEMMEMK